MIVEWIMQLSAGFLDFVADWFPPLDLPEWIEHPFDGVEAIASVVVGANTWIDVAFVGGVAVVALGAYVAGFVVRLARALIAHIPAIGGGG